MVEMAVLLVELIEIRESAVLIWSDNQEVIRAFDRGWSGNWIVNQCIRWADIVGSALNTLFTLKYVESKDNLADPVSYGERVSGFSPLPCRIPLPEALYPFLYE